ncbi:MAG: carbon-nitrogen hydrolase family protein [Angelakisella sp.]|jgi:nitrilase|nr:carbon-nitrogen hydrolase family protein [Angelakisella sp.]MCI9528180.1 carbon-nitrogen hydrolase family protein [Angelakisella sp.]
MAMEMKMSKDIPFVGDKLPKFRAAAVQTSPVFLNRDATIDKIEVKVKEAKDNGADLVVFPESFVPTFPVWCLFMPPVDQHPFYKRLFENSVAVPSPSFYRLQRIARENKVFLSIGICEKSTENFGTMWNSNLLFDRDGNLIGHHRKLLPTWGEKLVWSFGNGSSLNVHDTEIGRIGALICGENSNTLARYTMVAQGEQVHISIYPPCWPTARAKSNYYDCLRVRTCAHAFEAKVFNICCSASIDADAIEQMSCGDPEVKAWLEDQGFATTMIVGPNGQPISDILKDNEDGIVYADCDIANEITMKGIHDIAGAYQRFDVFQLHVNKADRGPAYFYNDTGASREFIPFEEEEPIE